MDCNRKDKGERCRGSLATSSSQHLSSYQQKIQRASISPVKYNPRNGQGDRINWSDPSFDANQPMPLKPRIFLFQIASPFHQPCIGYESYRMINTWIFFKTMENSYKAKCKDETLGWDCSNENQMQSTCLQKCTHENRYTTKKCICRISSYTGSESNESGSWACSPEIGHGLWTLKGMEHASGNSKAENVWMRNSEVVVVVVQTAKIMEPEIKNSAVKVYLIKIFTKTFKRC